MSYPQMLYGAALSAVFAALLLRFALRERQPATLLLGAAAAFTMPLFWNYALRRTGATGLFSHDIPFKPFPISWQDTGSGMFTLAGAGQLFAWTGNAPSRTTAARTLTTALAALLIDIYTY